MTLVKFSMLYKHYKNNYDFKLINDGTLNDLNKKIETMIDEVL